MSTHYLVRGGASRNTDYCGVFSMNLFPTASTATWDVGAALL